MTAASRSTTNRSATNRSTVSRSTLRLPAAADPTAGPLPILRLAEVPADLAEAPPEMATRIRTGRPRTLLPYTSQDAYTRERTEREFPTVVLQNEFLTATFLPSHGGRLWSLTHQGRELLHRNPVLQPANLALRDAWFAGGVEWNLGTTGHWPLTCSPLHAVRLRAPDGTPGLRMYEFERQRRLVLQIDVWLPESSPVLYVQVTIHNTGADTVPAYWWSNIAVPETDRTRVLAPSDRAFHFDYTTRLRLIEFPDFQGSDRSYPAGVPTAADYFFDLPHGERPWIAALDETGQGLVQTSTDRLHGRKLFHWGNGRGGSRWQEWLSGPDARYLEIQAGLAPTQLEHVPMPPRTTWSWTEAYGHLSVPAEAVHGRWEEARTAAAAALEALVPRAELDARHQRLSSDDAEVVEVLFQGSDWGALEVAAGDLPALPGLPFGTPQPGPWLELVRTGQLPVCDPPAPPVTGTHWRQRLETRAEDWHALYQLGLLRLADGDESGARTAWLLSVADRRTPWALHALAALADAPEAAELLLEAHALAPGLRSLTVEALTVLLAAGRPAAALSLVDGLEPAQRQLGRIQLLEAQAAAALPDQASRERAFALLSQGIEVPNLREGEQSLDELWEAVSPTEPLPTAYDFRMR